MPDVPVDPSFTFKSEPLWSPVPSPVEKIRAKVGDLVDHVLRDMPEGTSVTVTKNHSDEDAPVSVLIYLDLGA